MIQLAVNYLFYFFPLSKMTDHDPAQCIVGAVIAFMCTMTRMCVPPFTASRVSEADGVCRLPLLVLRHHQKVPDRLQRGPAVHRRGLVPQQTSLRFRLRPGGSAQVLLCVDSG